MSARTVTVVGAGGVIGSHLIPHLARTPEITRLTLVDKEVYEPKNLLCQNVSPADIGQPKASVQARRAREIAPRIDVLPFEAAVEDVPLGLLRADVLLACVDSRMARRSIHEICWRLRLPWIDAAVRSDGLLVRLNAYTPAPDQPCAECDWDERDYGLLEEAYPCGAELVAAPTNAPSALGALAAALQALEGQKILLGQWADVAVARQVTLSAVGHRQLVTGLRRNPGCRFDHATWTIVPVEGTPDLLTVDEVFHLAGVDADPRRALRVPGQVFARMLVCPRCSRTRERTLHLLRRLPESERRCDTCGVPMQPGGLDRVEWLQSDMVPSTTSLADLGVMDGDVLTIRSSDGATHYQIGALL